MRRLVVWACAALSGCGLAACGIGEQNKSELTNATQPPLAASGSTRTAPPGEGPTVSMQNISFAPASIHVTLGKTVRWRNDDGVAHTVVARQGASFRSGTVDSGASFRFKPSRAGTIRYVCTIHPNMAGTLVVGG